jgi:ferredoxin
MTYRITTDCICCGACEPECPVEVISRGSEVYLIDSDLCTGCGACLAVCPVGAIVEIDRRGA